MKIIDVQWGNLYSGYQLVQRLEDKLQSRMGRTNPAGGQSAEVNSKASQEKAKKIKQADLPIRTMYSPQEEAEYRHLLAKEYEKFMAYLVIGGAFGITLLCTLIGIPLALLLGYFIYRQYRVYDNLRQLKSGNANIELKPHASRLHSSTEKASGSGESVLLPQWWQKLTESNPQTQRERTHGTAGVEALVDLFNTNLSDEFIVVQELLVRGGLDADVILLGPKGIWVLESKNWSGKIICKDGEWSQSKDYVKSRGKHDKKITEHPRGPDIQWIQERDNLAQTLQRRLPEYKWLTSFIHGGIVFTIPDVELSIDSTCKTEVGKPIYWLRRIQKNPDVPRFTVDIQLQVIDALTAFAGRYEEGVGTCSSETMATQLYQAALVSKRGVPIKNSSVNKVPANQV